MSRAHSDTPEAAPPTEAVLTDEARRSRIAVRPKDTELIGKFMGCMGLDVQTCGTIQVDGPNAEQAQEAALLGWSPLAHRTPEEVGAGITRVVRAFQAFMNATPSSREQVYIQVYEFNELLAAERIANTDPIRRSMMIIGEESGTVPYPGMSVTEQANQGGASGFALELVPDLWNATQPPASSAKR